MKLTMMLQSIIVVCLLVLTPEITFAQSSVRLPPNDVSSPANTLGNRNTTDVWRKIRQGQTGLPAMSKPSAGANVLINAQGTWWSKLRTQQLTTYGGAVLGAVVLAIIIYFVSRGRIPIENGRAGPTIVRFSVVSVSRIGAWRHSFYYWP